MEYRKVVLALGMLLLIAGCTTRPIVNITDSPVIVRSGTVATADQVRDAIVAAGTGLGWVMTPVSPGLVSGRLSLRDHVAFIDVRYTARTFSITYKESTNLNYRDGQIHKNYNGWIENLDRDIRAQLLKL
ncbi:MAG: hypothetical protein ABI607_12650 [Betaproteobacteria bacterium]